MTSTYAPVTCPHCGKTNASWKAKVGQWECNDCDQRFAGAAPESGLQQLGDKALRAQKTFKPMKIFFTFPHDNNAKLVEQIKKRTEISRYAGLWRNGPGLLPALIGDSRALGRRPE